MAVNTCREGRKRVEPGSFQWCPGTEPEPMGTHCKKGGFSRIHFFIMSVTEHWPSFPIDVVAPPWIYLKAIWTQSWATSHKWPYLSRGLDQTAT